MLCVLCATVWELGFYTSAVSTMFCWILPEDGCGYQPKYISVVIMYRLTTRCAISWQYILVSLSSYSLIVFYFIIGNMNSVWCTFTAVIMWNNSYTYVHKLFALLLFHSAYLFADITWKVTSFKIPLWCHCQVEEIVYSLDANLIRQQNKCHEHELF